MKTKTMKVGIGNTCGPSFAPVKVHIEYEVEMEDGDHEAEYALWQKTLGDVEDLCLEALLRLKGQEEADKFKKERGL